MKCALCYDAPCSIACPKLKPDKLLRSIWFDNENVAAASLPEENPYISCDAPCERACVRSGEVPVKDVITRLYDEVRPSLEVSLPKDEIRLRTDICGIPLENPFLLSSSVVASSYDMCSFDKDRCIGCGRCVIACADGGHQAIKISDDRKISLDGSRCVGCHLCILVCPEEAIGSSRKRIHRPKKSINS